LPIHARPGAFRYLIGCQSELLPTLDARRTARPAAPVQASRACAPGDAVADWFAGHRRVAQSVPKAAFGACARVERTEPDLLADQILVREVERIARHASRGTDRGAHHRIDVVPAEIQQAISVSLGANVHDAAHDLVRGHPLNNAHAN